MTKKKTDLWETRGPAPTFGKPSGLHSKDSLDDIFATMEQRLIAMSPHWEPTDSFYKDVLSRQTPDVNRAQLAEQLTLFRLHYGSEKPRDQLKWESLFLKWLVRSAVFNDSLHVESGQPAKQARQAPPKSWQQQVDEAHRLSVVENELDRVKQDNQDLRMKLAALENQLLLIQRQIDPGD